MSSTLRKPMTLDTFLAWEERQEVRYEFDGFDPVAMTGGTEAHEAIGTRLRTLLDTALRGTPCHVRGPSLKILVDGHIRYPDAFVTCTRTPRDSTIAAEPVVVFEVLSRSTSRTDRILKVREYLATPSIQRYVILEQTAIAATVLLRAGTAWQTTVLTGSAELAMPEIGVTLTLSDIYADVELPPDDAPEDEGG
jgi:Uma2 family endonuclease